MLRITAATVVFLAQMTCAHAGECEPMPNGTVFCEQDGVFLLIDPSSGVSVDVTQQVLAAMLGGELTGDEAGAAAPEPEPPEAESPYFEDRLTGLCADGGCPSGLTGAIDSLNGYSPSYQ